MPNEIRELTEAETLAFEWSTMIPMDLTPQRAQHVLRFVKQGGEEQSVIRVIQHVNKLVSEPSVKPLQHERRAFRTAVLQMRIHVYGKQGNNFNIATYTNAGQYIPEMDQPCLTWNAVLNYAASLPYLQTLNPMWPIDEALVTKAAGPVFMLTRIDGLQVYVGRV